MNNLNGETKLPGLLIVDDDTLIRDTLHLTLADEFDILLAPNRSEAITLLRAQPTPPQLALLDLGLPPTPHRPDKIRGHLHNALRILRKGRGNKCI